jgi:glycosyltransferase involved in cell wall biosynthesis
MLIDAFQSLRLDDCRLLLKATCKQPVNLKIPSVIIINGIVSHEQLDSIHSSCDCYVNCSFSEGVGMGAVEAAMRDKPCIIPDYGGLREYVKTPYVIPCGRTMIGVDDFLYEKNMVWGMPSKSDLMKFMRECHSLQLRSQDHSFTRMLVRSVETEFPLCAQ